MQTCMECTVGMECDFEVGIAKQIGQMTYHGVIIIKHDPCFGAGGSCGGGCKWRIVCG